MRDSCRNLLQVPDQPAVNAILGTRGSGDLGTIAPVKLRSGSCQRPKLAAPALNFKHIINTCMHNSGLLGSLHSTERVSYSTKTS